MIASAAGQAGRRAPLRAATTAMLAALLAALAAGCVTTPDGPAPAEPLGTRAGGATSAPGAPALAEPAVGRTPATADPPVADPARLRIPAIGVDAPMLPLRVEHGVLAAPDRDEVAGWWRDGPEPGERGPAVIAGHVDSRSGPAVFFRLRELDRGARILVDRTDGSTAEFVAVRTEQHAKDAFPTEAVYGPTADTTLRLVTCGGSFDRRARSYLDNVIVYAVGAPHHSPPAGG
jgi:sortase (surface protein transpeptidase)